MKYIDEINLENKRVFMRLDLNVPMKNGVITDDTRIRAALPSIQYALENKAKLLLASHLGRPKGEASQKYSLQAVGIRLSELLQQDVLMTETPNGDAVKKMLQDLMPGKVILMENLRFDAREEENDDQYSKYLASLTDVYINDAFGAVHRAHASTVGMVPLVLEKAAGFLIKEELIHLNKLSHEAKKPFVAVLGGAKVSDKLGVIEQLITKVDTLLIGGAMAFTFLKAQGKEIGKSLCEEKKLHAATKILERAKLRGVEIVLPEDHLMGESIESTKAETSIGANVKMKLMGLDLGPQSIKKYCTILKEANTIFWNGPMGLFENPTFSKGSLSLAQSLAANEGAFTVVGGGDSVAAMKQSGFADKIDHISTGGGASLEFLEGKTLPGLAALEET